MTDEHDPESCNLVVNFGYGKTSSVDCDVSLLDDIWHLGGIGESKVVSNRITVWLFGRDFSGGVDMALSVSAAHPESRCFRTYLDHMTSEARMGSHRPLTVHPVTFDKLS
jgi:hypothetical protein